MEKIDLTIGDSTLTVFVEKRDGVQWVALKPLCDALGISSQTQVRRLRKNPQFKVVSYDTPSEGGVQEMSCLPVEEIGMWVCNINASKVKLGVRAQLILFQRRLQVVIYEALMGRVTPEKMANLEERLEKALSLAQQSLDHTVKQATEIRQLTEDNKQLRLRISFVEAGTVRYEDAEASAAGTRMVQKRWANRARNLAKIMQ